VLDAARTALIPLRPLTIGEILDGSFLVVRRNARMMIGLPLVIAAGTAAYGLLGLGLWFLLGNTVVEWAQIALIIVMALFGLFLLVQCLVWMTAILSRVSLQTVLGEGFAPSGERVSLRSSLPMFFPILGLSVLQYVASSVVQSAVSLLGYALLIPALTLGESFAGIASIGSMILMFIVTALSYGYLSLTVPALAVESSRAPGWIGKPAKPTNVITSFARSFTLIGLRNSGRVTLVFAGAMVICAGLIVIVAFGLLLVITLFARSVSLNVLEVLGNPWTIGIVLGFAAVVSMSGLLAFVAAVQTLMYLDLRMRREGLDLALRFDCVPIPQPSAPPPVYPPPGYYPPPASYPPPGYPRQQQGRRS
jgi:hypothetical protein